jgi:hypothetical protein
MQCFQQIAPGFGLLFVSCMVAAVVVQGCQPGKLCDKDEYQELCENPQLGGTGGGGSGGGGTGGGGSGGNRDGGGMEMLKVVTRDTPVADCPNEFNTVGKMDAFFKMRCGPDGSNCHTPAFAIAWRDFNTADVWMRMADPATKTAACAGSRIIDNRNWASSLMLAKVKDPVACPPGSTGAAGLRMPPPGMVPMMNPLSADELKCLENFVRAATGN